MGEGIEVIELGTIDPCVGNGKALEVWKEEDRAELCIDSADARMIAGKIQCTYRSSAISLD